MARSSSRSPPARRNARRSSRSATREPARGRGRSRSASRSAGRGAGRGGVRSNTRSSPPGRSRANRRGRSPSSSSSGSSASSRSRTPSRSRSRGRTGGGADRRRGGGGGESRRRRSRSVSSRSRSRSRSSSSSRERSPRTRGKAAAATSQRNGRGGEGRGDSKDDVKRESKATRSVTPPRSSAKRPAQTKDSPAVAAKDEPKPKRERSPSIDMKAESERESSSAGHKAKKTHLDPEAKDDTKQSSGSSSSSRAAGRKIERDDTKTKPVVKDETFLKKEKVEQEKKRRSPSAERTPSQKDASRTPSPRKAKQPDDMKSEVEEKDEEKTPPRESAPSTRKRSNSGDKTPPRKSKTSGRSSRRSKSSERTPPRKSRQKRSERERERRRRRGRSSSRSSSSSSGSSSSSSGSDSERTPPRSSRKKDRKSQRADRAAKSAPKSTPAKGKEAAAKADADAATAESIKRVSLFANDSKSGRTGGVYIPPFKLAQMHQNVTDKSSPEYQRQTWDALRKSINGLINKVNVSNISNIIPELFQENLVRARGLVARSIMKAQLASPGFTHIYAALVAVINTKMPENGELVVKRVVHRFRRAFKRGDKVVAIALVRFIAHLVNQQVVHELLALEVLTLLLANPTDDSVEVAVNFTKECGQILAELCPEGLRAIFERFRGILHEGEIDKRVQYTIEGLFAIRKGGFADYPAVHEQLDLVESGDQITHETTLEEEIDREDKLDVFRVDPDYEKNEAMWASIKKEILGESDSDSDGESGSSGSDDDGDSEDEAQQQHQAAENAAIQDMTEQDLVNLRRTIYLTIMSSISHEECAHKLMKLNIRPGQEKEICSMLIECCSQERTYLRYYGLLGQRFCMIKREYQDGFDECFAEQYALIHRLETNKLRNVAKFFAHLLLTDALPWTVFEYIRLNEEETTSSSRIFIKILCQELSEHMGLKKLKERFFDEIMQDTFAGVFPKDNPRNTRFAINFFTSIGLGGLTTDLREFLKNAPKLIMAQSKPAEADSSSSSDNSDSDSDSSSSSGSSSSGSSSGSSSSSDSSDSSDSD